MEKILKEILKTLKSIDHRLRKIERNTQGLTKEDPGQEISDEQEGADD